jgi:cytochrome c2
MMGKGLIVGTAVFVASAAAAFAQDIAAGQTAFTKCQPCHSVG